MLVPFLRNFSALDLLAHCVEDFLSEIFRLKNNHWSPAQIAVASTDKLNAIIHSLRSGKLKLAKWKNEKFFFFFPWIDKSQSDSTENVCFPLFCRKILLLKLINNFFPIRWCRFASNKERENKLIACNKIFIAKMRPDIWFFRWDKM